ncbi:vacuolar protein sorting protein VPS11 [Acrasis kona]|uniref:Vacuolar protein sorting protein VPS11 n=1 Tax=Acrasis kona TaxID=1008807 RepID=A0AAW2YI24_9EUKA
MHVNYIFQEWGQIFILVTEQSESTQSLFILEEKDTPTKLEILLQKNLYQIAIGLVNSQQLDSSYVVEIHRKFGDHLYSKKEYEQAMSQYLKTIGKLEPSYVIRKFLDAQRIKNLTTYLEALHTNEHNIATADHTTLLLNCYTKLKNDKKEKLDMFIRTQNELRYDVETAIHVCRQAGYREHALLLAKKHKEHGWFIKIHIEDFQRRRPTVKITCRALRHIESLRFELAHTYLKEFGKILVSKLPQQTTNVLIRLCTDYFAVDYTELDRSIPSNIFKMREKLLSKNKNLIRNQNAQNEVNQQSNTNLDTTNHDNDDVMTSATRLTSLFSKRKNQTEAITHNSVNDPTHDLNNTIDDLSTLNTYKDPFKAIANAEDFIDAYSNQAYWLMIFLENVITRNPKSPPQSKIVYNTLIELYLQLNANPEEPSQPVNSTNQSQQQQQQPQDQNKEQWDAQYANMFNDSEEVHSTSPTVNQTPDYHIEPTNPTFQQSSYETKILDLVENIDSNYDTEHVLVLVQSMNFKQGILKMYERLGLHYDIVQYYMEQGDYENVISSCKKYGESDLNLWVQVLSYFANSEALEFQDEIQNVLLKIEKDNLLPPLLVVQILSKHPKTKLGNIKEYLHNKLSQDQLMIKEDVDKIKDYQNSTKKMKREVHALQTSAKIFQSTTCQRCNDQLDLPAVHFMCQHSFHARCLPDQDDCPTCAKHSRDILQHKKKFDENGPEQQEAFFKQLGKKNADGFSVVAEYFGRGIFNQASHGGGGGDLDHDDFE